MLQILWWSNSSFNYIPGVESIEAQCAWALSLCIILLLEWENIPVVSSFIAASITDSRVTEFRGTFPNVVGVKRKGLMWGWWIINERHSVCTLREHLFNGSRKVQWKLRTKRVNRFYGKDLYSVLSILHHGRQNRSRRYRNRGTNVEAKVMNFIISDPASADSAQHLFPSRAACVLRVREQDVARGWVLYCCRILRRWLLIFSCDAS